MDQSILQLAGASPSKATKFVPLGTRRFFSGLYTSRNPLQEPGTRAESRFYGGRPDTLWAGQNIEVSANNTLIRRPGHSLLAALPSPALSYVTFRPPNAAISVIADTALGPYNITPSTPVNVFSKSAGAGQTFFQPLGTQLFMADGVDLLKWDGTHLWNWGIAPPSIAPALSISYGAGPQTVSLSVTPGGTLTGQGTLYAQTTWITPFGETLASPEMYMAVPDDNELVVNTPSNPPSNATGWNVYIGAASGTEKKQNTTPIALTLNYTVTAAITTTGASVPTMTTAGTYTITSPLGVSYVFCYQNGYTDHPSTASPGSAYTGPQTNIQITRTGPRSTDVQVSHIQIYRTTDGGATYLLLATIANPTSGNWTYVDVGIADSSLNADIIAPQAMANNPPPAGLTNLTYFGGCIWGSVGNYYYFSNGALTTNGSGNESWPPLNYGLLPSKITRFVPFPSGMLIFTVDDLWFISGPGATPIIYQAGLGAPNYNAIDINGSTIYVYTTDGNVLAITPGAGVIDLGFGIAGLFAGIDVSKVSLSYYISGHNDNALFVSDGSGNIWRCNPNQQPEGGAVWSTQATVAGATFISAVETTAGVHKLAVSVGNNVLVRDWSVSTDNGSAYNSWAVIGSIMLALPGQLCEVQCFTIEALRVGSQPTIGVLLDEIAGTFEALPLSEPDPPGLAPSQSVYSNRHYLNQSEEPVVCRHLQLRIDFGEDEVQNELLSYSIYGCLHSD